MFNLPRNFNKQHYDMINSFMGSTYLINPLYVRNLINHDDNIFVFTNGLMGMMKDKAL
jgi:hypothetical protein